MSEFWKDKKVFVTGGTGFMGTWLVKELVDKGANTSVLTRKFPKTKNFNKLGLDKKTKLILGNVLDLNFIKNYLKENQIEHVFHLAAQSTVEECLKQPLSALETNVLGTANILEACRESPYIKSIVFASSTRVYGDSEKTPYKENSRLEATNSIYNSSKMHADYLVQTYGKLFNIPACSARFSLLYGGGDFNFTRIIPETIKKILDEEEISLRSNGLFKLSPLYIKDAVNACLELAEKIEKERLYGEGFNFSGRPIMVLDLIKKIINISKKNPILNLGIERGKDKDASHEKAKRVLGWFPKYSLDEGLKETYEWYKKYFGK